MAFIQSCFIRKNTPELRKKLLEIGHTLCPCTEFEDADWLSVSNNKDLYRSVHGLGYTDEIINIPKEDIFNNFLSNTNRIDCGTNEELFLAIAAMRDDTPINSYYWFKDNLFKCEGLEIDRVLKNNTANYLLKCRSVDNSMIISCFKERNIRKATIEEIVEHFK